MEQIIFNDELGRFVLPRRLAIWASAGWTDHHAMGYRRTKALLLAADSQRRRHLVSGYSEPGAGSDLAGLQTRAVDMGESFVINGQKVWTSGAQFAQWIVLLARTDPRCSQTPRHQLLSTQHENSWHHCASAGADEVHTRHFNEVFFEDMRAPRENLLGPKNEGWKVAITTLMFERSFAGGGSYSAQVRRLAALAKQVSIDGRLVWEQSWVRQKLAQFAIECEALKYTAQRNLTRQLKGQPPGPEGSYAQTCAGPNSGYVLPTSLPNYSGVTPC